MKGYIFTTLLLFILLSTVKAETEPNNTCAEANVLILNSSITGEFGVKGDWDYYTVYIPTAGAINISVLNSDPNVQIGLIINNNCISGLSLIGSQTGESFYSKVLIPEPGYYNLLLINNLNKISVSQYTLIVETDISDIYEYNNTIPSASLVSLNSDINANLDGLDFAGNVSFKDKDYYKFKITEPGLLGISVGDINSTTQIHLNIYNENGEYFSSDPCSGLGEGIELYQLAICDTGYYYLEVYDANFENKFNAGPYTLKINFNPDDCNHSIDSARKIEIGQQINDRINNLANNFYAFEIKNPIVLNIKINELEDSLADKKVSLLDENGSLIWDINYYDNYGLDPYKDNSICTPGKYFLKIGDGHNQNCVSKKSIFKYDFTVSAGKMDKYECNNEEASAAPINVDEEITTSFDFYGDMDYFIFPILKDDSLIVQFNITEAQIFKAYLQDANHILPIKSLLLSGSNALQYNLVFPKGGFSGNYILYTKALNTYSHDDYSFIIKTGSKLTGTNNLQTEKINIYPNPFKDNLQLDLSNQSFDSGFIDITDILGNSVKHSYAISGKQSIDLSNLIPGCYFVTIMLDGNKVTKKIIKE